MSQQKYSPSIMFNFGRKLVEMHDQDGFPIDLSLDMSKEKGLKPCLLGILCEMTKRKWGRMSARMVVNQYKAKWGLTSGEQKALDILEDD